MLSQSSSTGMLATSGSGWRRAARPLPGSLPHTRSLTDFNKDKEGAYDMADRQKRFSQRQATRLPAIYGQKYGTASQYGPLVRSPSCEEVPLLRSSSTWHRDRVESVFTSYDKKGMREASLADLRTSFKPLNVPIDDRTFKMYVDKFVPPGVDGVNDQDFFKIHQNVWEKQWRHVHTHAGDPSAAVQDGSSPLLLRDGETRLRMAFSKYAKSSTKTPCGGRVRGSDMHKLLSDLGLDPIPGEKLLPDGAEDQMFPYHEVVEFINQYISKSEARRDVLILQSESKN